MINENRVEMKTGAENVEVFSPGRENKSFNSPSPEKGRSGSNARSFLEEKKIKQKMYRCIYTQTLIHTYF